MSHRSLPVVEKPRWEDYARCVHCGLCLYQCPTYRLWGREADSPRGRIRQMLHVDYGGQPLDAFFVLHIDRCLDCRACETACPSGVEYGQLVELARAQIEARYRRRWPSRWARSLFYRHLLPFPGRMAALARALRALERIGRPGAWLGSVRRESVVAYLAHLVPPIDREFFFSRHGAVFPAHGPRRARVALFAGCIPQLAFSHLNEATIRVLQANGCDVVVPAGQWCCGALAVHAGFRDVAAHLARRTLEIFSSDSFDAIVTHTAGCGSTLKEYERLFPSGTPEQERARGLARRVRDVTEWLHELGWTAPLKSLPVTVTYQDSCHLLHGQRIRHAPRHLLRRIPALTLVEMEGADQCCGSAGVYNLVQPRTARDLLREKMRAASATGASILATANPGCILQLRAGAALWQTGQQVVHVVELLEQALAGSDRS